MKIIRLFFYLLATTVACVPVFARHHLTNDTPSPVASPAPSPKSDKSTSASTNGTKPNENGKPDSAAKSAVTVPPEKAKAITIPKFEKPPVIDGKLDDAVWQSAAVLKDFYQIQPGDNLAPSKPTEVLIGYDPKFLYVAFRVIDEPDKVRATVAKRDNIFNDDYVGMMLDTFNDQRKAFEFFFNPLGIQGDGVITEGRGEDFSVDVLMESKGLVHETGFNVEIAIPFKSIRYEAARTSSGAHTSFAASSVSRTSLIHGCLSRAASI